MTDETDRLAAVEQLIREAIEEVEGFDDWTLGWVVLALLQEIERQLVRGIHAERGPSRRATVVEFFSRHDGRAKQGRPCDLRRQADETK